MKAEITIGHGTRLQVSNPSNGLVQLSIIPRDGLPNATIKLDDEERAMLIAYLKALPPERR